jgi:casein kinase 1
MSSPTKQNQEHLPTRSANNSGDQLQKSNHEQQQQSKDQKEAGTALATAPASTSKQERDRKATSMAGNSSSSSSSPTIVGSHYKIGKKIGEGSFGIIYEGLTYQ